MSCRAAKTNPPALVIGGSSAGLSGREGQLRPGSGDVIVGGYSSIEDLLTIVRQIRRRAEREERYHRVDRCQLAFKEHRAPLISEHKRESSKKKKNGPLPSSPGPRRPWPGLPAGRRPPPDRESPFFLLFFFPHQVHGPLSFNAMDQLLRPTYPTRSRRSSFVFIFVFPLKSPQHLDEFPVQTEPEKHHSA